MQNKKKKKKSKSISKKKIKKKTLINHRTSTKEFMQDYETLTDLVVPRSCERLIEDNDFVLYRLVVFSRIAEDFKRAAAEKK